MLVLPKQILKGKKKAYRHYDDETLGKLKKYFKTDDIATIAGTDLTSTDAAAALCRMIEESEAGQIILDFAGIHSVNPAFAIEYMERKEICTKIITEINLSFWVQKAVDDAVSKLQAPEIRTLAL